MVSKLQSTMSWSRNSLRELVMCAFPSRSAEIDDEVTKSWQPDAPSAYCHRCGLSVGPGEASVEGCHACRGSRLHWDRVVRLGAYKSPLRERIVAMKFGRAWPYARAFGDQLGHAVGRPDGKRSTVVCPVPLHWRRRLSRGYDQTMLIAKAFAAALDLPLMPLLRRVKYTAPMTLQFVSKRDAVVRHAFVCEPVDLTGHDVWLIDDVLTTGATLRSCCRELRKCKPERINVAVLAKSAPNAGDFKEG